MKLKRILAAFMCLLIPAGLMPAESTETCLIDYGCGRLQRNLKVWTEQMVPAQLLQLGKLLAGLERMGKKP